MYVHKVTSEDIYPTGYSIPLGYQIVDFRPPKQNEFYIANRSYSRDPKPWVAGHGLESPRFVLERIKTKVVTFRATGETRRVKPGEWYYGSNSTGDVFWQHNSSLSETIFEWPLYTRTETEE